MSLTSVIAHIEYLALHKRQEGRVNFERDAGAAIQFGDLNPAEIEQAQARLMELAGQIPVVLTTQSDRDEATRLCQRAAHRLALSPWYPELTTGWPAPIAHEAYRLEQCLAGDSGLPPSPEAALLQLRDLAETLVKFPASVLARRLIERGGDGADEMRRRLRAASGGNWIELGRQAAERLQAAEPAGPLAGVAGLFKAGSAYHSLLERLATARNNYIGHGALRTNPADTARLVAWFAAGQSGEDVPNGPTGPIPAGATIKSGLEAAVPPAPWRHLRLRADAPEGPIDLTGAVSLQTWHADARHKQHNARTLPLSLAIDGQPALRLSPLIHARICRECGFRDVFFFDSVYQDQPAKIDFLDYGRGHKSRLDREAAQDLLNELGPPAPAPPGPEGASLDSRTAVAALDMMRVDRRYRSPGYLRKPFAAFLAAHDRGIFWLQAPAHIGKTMFAQGLAQVELGDEPIMPGLGPGGGIAAFFCKREFREGQTMFLNSLGDTFLRVIPGTSDKSRRPAANMVLQAGSEDRRRAFLAWVDAWRAIGNPPGQKLVLVIDGLDETDPPGQNSLLSLLPAADSLTEGLFILLISRPVSDPDCPDWLGGALTPLMRGPNAETPQPITRETNAYQELMRDYARDRLGWDRSLATTARIDKIIAQSERLFNIFSFYVEQMLSGQAEMPAGDARGEALFEHFLAGLEDRYGSKRADGIRAILASLAAAELAHAWVFGEGAVDDIATGGKLEPMDREFLGLELDTLALAAGMDELTDGRRRLSLAFVESLLLLQGVLWVWRGAGGQPRYRLGLKGFAQGLERWSPEPVARAHSRLATSCLDATEEISSAMGERAVPPAIAEQLLRDTVPLLNAFVELSGSALVRHRFQQLPVGNVSLFVEARHGTGKTPIRQQIFWYNALLAVMHNGCGPQDDQETRLNDLAGAYMNRGNAKQFAPGFGPGAAIADYDAAIGLMETPRDDLGEAWPVPWRNNLANAYANRGNAKQSAPGFGPGAAMADCDAAIEIMEALRDALGEAWPMPWRNNLAIAYKNRGNAKQSAPGFGPGAAIADYDASIGLGKTLRDALGEAWPMPWRNDLANAYMNRAISKRQMPAWGTANAANDAGTAIMIWTSLVGDLGEQTPPGWRVRLGQARQILANWRDEESGE